MGFEEEELLPFKEPTLDISDQKRIEMLVGMGYPRTDVEESLRLHKFDDTYASYLLLGRKNTDVSTVFYNSNIYLLLYKFWFNEVTMYTTHCSKFKITFKQNWHKKMEDDNAFLCI